MLLICIREVFHSKLGQDTCYTVQDYSLLYSDAPDATGKDLYISHNWVLQHHFQFTVY